MYAAEEKKVTELAREFPGLDLLMLFGSRARGDDYSESDWDFAYLAGTNFDPDEFLARLVLLLDTDRIDLVDLRRANGLLRYRAAAEGRLLFASKPEVFDRFWFEASSFWWDMEPVFKEGYEAILRGLVKT
jgi:predicted nucleotidyltransferase